SGIFQRTRANDHVEWPLARDSLKRLELNPHVRVNRQELRQCRPEHQTRKDSRCADSKHSTRLGLQRAYFYLRLLRLFEHALAAVEIDLAFFGESHSPRRSL